jgi:signal transduction histidine kinase/FixJ family two-component response regulator/HPt (histidine-containing phosphotransfer) domain-containing protein
MNLFTVQLITGINLALSVVVMFCILTSWGQPRMKYMTCIAVAVFLHSLGYFLEKCAPTLEAAIIAYKIQYCAGPYLGVFTALFSLDYIGKPIRKQRFFLPLFVIPLITTIIVLIRPLWYVREFIFTPIGNLKLPLFTGLSGSGGVFDIRGYGFFYYLVYIYNFMLLLFGTAVVVRQFIRIRKEGRIHNIIFVLAMILPFCSKVLWWINILRELDLFYIASTLLLLFIYLYIMRYRQLEWRILGWDTVMGKLTDAVLVINADKQIVNINHSFQEFFPGFTYNDTSTFWDLLRFMKRRISSTIPQNLLEELSKDDQAIIHGEFSMDENTRTFSLTRQLIRVKDRLMGYTFILNDVSAYRTMIDEIGKLKQKAEEGSKTKSEFLATMSHEIRTPLNAIIGFSEILLQQQLPKDTHTYLEKIHNSGSVLLGIISDTLDISKIEAGNLELVPVNYTLASLINDTVHLNLIRIGSKPIVFELDIDETIPAGFSGDELRVKQILNNLLSNAFKYTQEGKVILQVRWTPVQSGGDTASARAMLSFRVKDTGQGITKEDIPKLFFQYHQLNAQANRNVEGTGLGLAITKNLVEMMGGSIEVESEYKRGSSFSITILQDIVDPAPIGKETAKNLRQFRFIDSRRQQRRAVARTRMPGCMVLVVDDVQTNLDVARGLLLPYGLSSDGVKSGQEVVARIRSIVEHPGTSQYDLIFMDHMMPGMDGLEATRLIRGIDSDYARNVPIIALTANALAGNREIFLENGITDFLAKPIDIQKLDIILEKWIPREKQSRISVEAGPSTEFVLSGAEPILEIEGVDTKAGLANTGNSFPVYRRILSVYSADALERLPQIQAAMEAEDFAGYTTMVHALKGISRSIGAVVVGDMAALLEEAGRAQDRAAVAEKTGVFLSALKALTERISAALDAVGETEGTESLSAARLEELKDALLEMDTEKANKLLAEYLSLPLDKTAKELIRGIEQDVLLFEYENAVAKLNSLAGA